MNTYKLKLKVHTKKLARIFGVLLLVIMAGMISPLGFQNASSAEVLSVNVGLVIDESGLANDWNQLIYQGLLDAQTDFGVVGTLYTATSPSDYESKLQQCIDDVNDLCISGGYLLLDVTEKLAQENPSQKFAIVDSAFFDGDWNHISYDNVRELTFRVDQAAFLAGYVAAGTSQTGKVGTYGGFPIPPVTIHMDGFWYGVQYYDTINSTNVPVLGWNPDTLVGLFTYDWTSFAKGQEMGNTLMSQGADIILSVGGALVGQGTAKAAQDQGSSYIIGTDTDWFNSYPAYGNVILTSDLKKMDVAVYDTIKSVVDGVFTGGFFFGTLANNGVGIAPFHDLDSLVPDTVKSDLDTIKAGIINGTIKTSHPCSQHIGLKLRECRIYLPITTR
jgi:basic membrane protein A